MARAVTGTHTTADAPVSMDTSREFEVNGTFRTGMRTAPALDTLSCRKGNLHLWILGLRVVAEDTPKGTSLEKDHAADTGAVLKTVPLDIDDKRDVPHLRIIQFRASG